MIFNTVIIDFIENEICAGSIISKGNYPFYNNEFGIRKPNLQFGYTNKEIEEMINIRVDIMKFVEYCKIKREDGTIGNITPYNFQKEYLNILQKENRVINLKPRQSGMTYMHAIDILHYCIYNNDKNVMIVANLRNTTIEILDKIMTIYRGLPFYMKPGIKFYNQTSIHFDNGCVIRTAATKMKTSSIGYTINYLYIDEFAHIPSFIIEAYYSTVYPMLESIKNSKIVISSTPNGDNLFYKIWTNANCLENDEKKNNYYPYRVDWKQIPGRNVTYIKVKDYEMLYYNLNAYNIFEQLIQKYGSNNVHMKYDENLQKQIIIVSNDKYTDIQIKNSSILVRYKFDTYRNINITELADVYTWKEQTIKEMGSIEAFEQEYELIYRIKEENNIIDMGKYKELTEKVNKLEKEVIILTANANKTINKANDFQKTGGEASKLITNPGQVSYEDVIAYKKENYNSIKDMPTTNDNIPNMLRNEVISKLGAYLTTIELKFLNNTNDITNEDILTYLKEHNF